MMLYAMATTARTFLAPHWTRWHEVWGQSSPTVASQWTCVRSSLFLMKALGRCGIDARLESGQPMKRASGVVSEDCGLFTAGGWMGHAWVEANGFVIDITADQFGHAPVIVIPANDAIYRPAQCKAQLGGRALSANASQLGHAGRHPLSRSRKVDLRVEHPRGPPRRVGGAQIQPNPPASRTLLQSRRCRLRPATLPARPSGRA